MNKDIFLKELKYNLRFLRKEEQNFELQKYDNLDTYDLNPVEIANKIYKERNLNIFVYEKCKLTQAVNTIIIMSSDEQKLGDIITFFIKLFIILLIIKIPFNYTKNFLENVFSQIFINDKNYMYLKLSIEFIYAIISILYVISALKKEAYMLKTSYNKNINKK